MYSDILYFPTCDVETDSDVENRKAYGAAGNFGEKSDILRYEVC